MSKTGLQRQAMLRGKYINFKFDVPEGAEHAEKLYVRLVAGAERADGKEGTPDKRGTLRIDSVVLTGSPVIAG